MSYESGRCPKCKGEMVRGSLVTKMRQRWHGPTEWLSGAAEWSFWTGLKTAGRDLYPVRADRCRDCGFVEFYAAKP